MRTKFFVREVPTLGFWSLAKGHFVSDWKNASLYTEEDTQTATRLFPNERWMLVVI